MYVTGDASSRHEQTLFPLKDSDPCNVPARKAPVVTFLKQPLRTLKSSCTSRIEQTSSLHFRMCHQLHFSKSPSRFAKVVEAANVHGERAHVQSFFRGMRQLMPWELKHVILRLHYSVRSCTASSSPLLYKVLPSHLHRSIFFPGGMVIPPQPDVSFNRYSFCLSTPWCSGL